MEIVVLAAGKGTRMHSDAPKVMHKIGGKPMLEHVLDTANELNPTRIHVVIGFGGEMVQSAMAEHLAADKINWVVQTEQLGTGHAVAQALPEIDVHAKSNPVLVLFGDVPLITDSTLERVLAGSQDDSLSLLTVHAKDLSLIHI